MEEQYSHQNDSSQWVLETIAEAVKKHTAMLTIDAKVYDNTMTFPFYYANFASALRNRGHLEDARKLRTKT